MTALLEYIDRLLQLPIIVHISNYAGIICLMLSVNHYAQNDASIIGEPLLIAQYHTL